jgi:hypothetical protein
MWDVERANAFAHARSREITALQQQARKDQRRDAMVDVIWRGLREGIGSAPDLFPNVDTRRLAEQVVDVLLGGRE